MFQSQVGHRHVAEAEAAEGGHPLQEGEPVSTESSPPEVHGDRGLARFFIVNPDRSSQFPDFRHGPLFLFVALASRHEYHAQDQDQWEPSMILDILFRPIAHRILLGASPYPN